MSPNARRALPLVLCALVCLAFSPERVWAGDTMVYADREFLSHWSESAVSATTEGGPFHGLFGSQTVSLTLNRLPRHRWIRLTFDLYIVGSWDGSSPVWGPDLWSLSVRGAQRLICASFCAWGYAGNDEQSYPDDFPQAIQPAWTGVARRNVVDIKDSKPPKNGVYKVEVLFPHTANSLVLDFAGSYQDPPEEQQVWGLGNVEAKTISEDSVTREEALPGLWEDLASSDGVKANAALWRFVGAGTKAFDFISERVGQMTDGINLSEAEGLRLHRAHRIVRIIGGVGTGDLCFKMDHVSIDYAKKYLGR